MKNNQVKMRQCFVQENLLDKNKSKYFSLLKTQGTYKLWKLDDFQKKNISRSSFFKIILKSLSGVNKRCLSAYTHKICDFSFFYFNNNSTHDY